MAALSTTERNEMGAPSLNKQAQRLIDAINAARQPQPDVVPDDWLTVNQVSQKVGVGRKQASELIKKLPKVERKMFRIRCGHDVRLVAHYRLP